MSVSASEPCNCTVTTSTVPVGENPTLGRVRLEFFELQGGPDLIGKCPGLPPDGATLLPKEATWSTPADHLSSRVLDRSKSFHIVSNRKPFAKEPRSRVSCRIQQPVQRRGSANLRRVNRQGSSAVSLREWLAWPGTPIQPGPPSHRKDGPMRRDPADTGCLLLPFVVPRTSPLNLRNAL